MLEVKVIALDLERTLVSDAMNREPRPGLFAFLRFCCASFPRIALFTSVNRNIAESVVAELAAGGFAPPEFADRLEYVVWEGKYKDLRFVPNAALSEIVMIDDDAGWAAPGQEAQWLTIAEYDPYLVRGEDREFDRIRALLETRLSSNRARRENES